ncbi:hypothetical protein [Lacihabitans lacunae]|uniref:Anti-sigma factor n=1 Tax=Lacihabitans lacunae TaxID=1028214 RepID=A0ABV7YZJ7_9BACT
MEEKDLDILDLYLRGELSPEDALLVEVRLANEPELNAIYEKMQLLAMAAKKQESRLKIKAVHQQKMQEWKEVGVSDKKNFSILKWTSFAAAACLVGILYLGNADFDMPSPVELQERSAKAENNSESVYVEFMKANELLNNKQYAAAAELFGKVSSDENYMPYYREMSRWYQVVAVSNVDERKAKEFLEAIEQTPNTKYEIPALEKMKMKIRLAF